MKFLLCFSLLLSSVSVSAKSENAWRALAEEAKKTNTVEQCLKSPSKFSECQQLLAASERAKFCGDFSLVEKVSGSEIKKAFIVISETCLKHARY